MHVLIDFINYDIIAAAVSDKSDANFVCTPTLKSNSINNRMNINLSYGMIT